MLLTIFIVTDFKLSQNQTTYFSITSTDKNLKNHYVCYDTKNQLTSEILSHPDTTQYPLGYTDRKNNILYYVKKDGKCDQIYAYNMATKQEVQVTTALYAVNDMFVFKDVIYATAIVKGQRNVSFIAISKVDYKIKEISEIDLNVESITLRRTNPSIYFVGYNMEEQFDLIEDYEKNSSEQLKNAVSKVFSYNIENKQVTLEFESEDMIAEIAVMNEENTGIVKLSEDVFTPFKFYWFDLKRKKITEEVQFKNIVRIDDMAFSNDDLHLYFLGVIKTNNYNQNDVSQRAPNNYIFSYDMKTSAIKEVLTLEERFMNNFEITTD